MEKRNREDIKKIQKLKQLVKKSLDAAPKGGLYCDCKKQKYVQYYYVEEGTKNKKKGKYINKQNLDLARKLAQRDYDRQVFELLDRFEKEELYYKYSFERKIIELFEKTPELRKRLITPWILSDEEYIKEWYRSFPEKKNTIEIENGYETERGETVRSKSEKIIADKLYYSGIPYLYEVYVDLGERGHVFTDFVALNVRERKTVYFEHFGMMDDIGYCNKALEKLERYDAKGLVVGKSLVISMETNAKGLNSKMIESIINNFLK